MKQWNLEHKPRKYASCLAYSKLENKNHYADFENPPTSIPAMPKKEKCPRCRSRLTSRFIDKQSKWMHECLNCNNKFASRRRLR